jgi:hypothetical protein
MYLAGYLEIESKGILSLLKYETDEELQERFDDIRFKLKLIREEQY